MVFMSILKNVCTALSNGISAVADQLEAVNYEANIDDANRIAKKLNELPYETKMNFISRMQKCHSGKESYINELRKESAKNKQDECMRAISIYRSWEESRSINRLWQKKN